MKIANNTKYHQGAKKFGGFGLIELMISIAISLVVVLAITSLFLMQKRSYSTQDDLSRLQENGRFMVQDLSRVLRLAGYRDTAAATDFTNPIISGANGTGSTGIAASDSFTVRFYGSSNLATPPVADGSVVDCNGLSVGRDRMVTETFSIQTVNGRPTLVCVVDATPQVVLFSNVESMQILYGEDGNQDGAVDRFRAANAADMALVRSVMISFVMSSNSTNNSAAALNVFNHFGEEYSPSGVAHSGDAGSVYNVTNDFRLRKQFAFSVALRNRLD